MGDLSKNFSRHEFACKCGCGFDTVDAETLLVLQRIRDEFGMIKINSACRCEAHNAKIGGSKNSQHLLGRAVDFAPYGADVSAVREWTIETFPAVSVGKYNSFVHIDTRSGGAKYW